MSRNHSPLMRKANTSQWLLVRRVLARTLPCPCPYCGRMVMAGQRWDIDHAIPAAQGGSDHLSNLRAAHRHCNRQAGQAMLNAGPRARARARTLPSREW